MDNCKTDEFLKGLRNGVVMLTHDDSGTGALEWRGIVAVPEGEFYSEANNALDALKSLVEQVHEHRN